MSQFQYEPEVEYENVKGDDDDRAVKLLDPFKKGLLHPLESHVMTADALRKYLDSEAVTPEIRQDFRQQSKEIENALMNIVRDYSQIEHNLSSNELQSIGEREYFNIFNDSEVDSRKLQFVRLLKTYELLKSFNLKARENWNFIREIFERVQVTSGNKLVLEQILTYKVYPRIELCDMTDLLLRRLAFILQLYDEQIDDYKVHAKGRYTSLLEYTFSDIFREDLTKSIQEGPTELEKKKKQQTQAKAPKKEAAVDTCLQNEYYLDSRGQEPFNQSYLYVLEVKPEPLEVDLRKIQQAIYIETHLGAEEGILRQDLIRKFISQAKSEDRVEEYRTFLHQYFSFTRETLLLHFVDLTGSEKITLLYHLAPVYFLKLVMNFMREGRTGFIHRRIRGNQMLRELPFEHLKYRLFEWWDEQVYRRISATDRNSRDLFDKIIRKTRDLWAEEQPHILAGIKNDPVLYRAFQLRDLKRLDQYVQEEASFLYHTLFARFLGPDFLYVPVRHAGKHQSVVPAHNLGR